ncbi:MAG: hypothetical protein ACHQAR_00065 [Steroidobacterales bacterium]
MSGAPAPDVPWPPPDSIRYFVLLYARAHRPRAQLLFALADEIAASLSPQLDHHVAHLRLAWWREESLRMARGEPQHGWSRRLFELPGEPVDLQALVAAAELELAQRLVPGAAPALQRPAPFAAALLCQLGGLLGDRPPADELAAAIADLDVDARPARRAAEPAARAARADAHRRALAAAVTAIDTARQPALAPRLVWAALAARRSRGGGRTRAAALLDNIVAWRAARAALRGQFKLASDG